MDIDDGNWQKLLMDGAARLGVFVSPDHAAAMGRHAREMLHWNTVSNLTTIVDPAAVALKHYVDSLAAAKFATQGAIVLDAGSGAGFPGIPLKILRPDLTVTLVDSVRRKISFLNYVISVLKLAGITAVHGRLEALGKMPEYRMRFDQVICRAFSSLEEFAAKGLFFLKPGGMLLAMKGPQASHDHETGTLHRSDIIFLAKHAFRIRMHAYELPFSGDQRLLVQLTLMGRQP
ncbi:16S rRNA (guanine(527)-N(7))-methyltransferase RsmG [Desulfosarcina sp. OttesenSCG-928-A07]|nr:16S rRNA (guanine(527)-N(7))-methyltransferase RsmG [Desulfosarcina sp. OttesenSCG-928-G17]MDL2328611.1 16S rRNA (guanine(527)-N(7))-methyltransferase RsmG [Desulfosarcina sp. OttesenSCG-928-A07]